MPVLSSAELIEKIAAVRTDYEKSTKDEKPNPERTNLLNILESGAELLKKMQSEYPEKELRKIAYSLYWFGLQTIAAKYTIRDPEYFPGYTINGITIGRSGSRLYSLLRQHGEVEKNITPVKKMRYLNKFYHFAFKEPHQEAFTEQLQQHAIGMIDAKLELSKAMLSVLKDIASQEVLDAIPTEEAISNEIPAMLSEYCIQQKQKGSAFLQDDIDVVKLIMATNALLPVTISDDTSSLERTQRIRMGLLLVAMQYKWNSYWYPIGNPAQDVVYQYCCKLLNIKKEEDFSSNLRLLCFNTLDWLKNNKDDLYTCSKNLVNEKTFLSICEKANLDQSQTRDLRNLFFKPVDVDDLIKKLLVLNESMSKKAENKLESSNSTFAMGLGSLVGILGAIPGYGVSVIIRNLIQQSVGTTAQFSQLTNYGITLIAGERANSYMGHYVANMLLGATLKRGFEKLCEALGLLLGWGLGFIATIAVTEITFQLVYNLYNYCWQVREHVKLAKEVDEKLVDCLLDMPSELFSEMNKANIRYTTQKGTFFQPEINKMDENQPAETIPTPAHRAVS